MGAAAVLCSVVASAVSMSTTSEAGAASPASPPVPAFVTRPAALVDPFAGTGTGSVSPGTVGELPGAAVPFGMLQWSPSTTPQGRSSGGGYAYADSHITGFSLTHLSGSGCVAYGDVPILPTVGPIANAPTRATATFSHHHESAAPGRYAVRLGPAGINVALTVTARTGLGQFRFPRTAAANLLFKVSDSANPVSHSAVETVGRDELVGQVASGGFCGTGTPYTLYFVARFDRPFRAEGTWAGDRVTPGAGQCRGAGCGAWVTFDATGDRVVKMKVGISYVSVAGAEANLAAENPGWSLPHVERRASTAWNALLGKIRVAGGSEREQRTFYTALYHSLLAPNLISDDNGEYMGDDHQVHSSGRPQYSDFSEWDIYRSEIQLLSLVAPRQTGDMIQSLVNDGEQNGWLPKWAIADGDASQMNGDSADPIIASAYAFGVHDFDVGQALAEMERGATQSESGHGLEIERQYLGQYLSQHYIDAGSLDLTSSNYSIGASATLEYAIDDFSIAQVAQALGNQALFEQLMQRSHNWQYLFNPATGFIEAKRADGSFPAGAAFQKDLFEPGGETGFEEGNAIQYTWSVPQDLSALGALMGGPAHAVAKLNAFFTHLNAGRFAPYDWAGNEPSMWVPWEYDYFGAPWRAQGVVRRIATTLYHDAPVDEPGNDDLGALSSWYVWAAIGLYPVTPGTANLALASPIFPRVSLELPSGHRLVLVAPAAAAGSPYVHRLVLSRGGRSLAWSRPWLPASVLSTGATLRYDLSSTPDRSWGAAPHDAPPSYGTGRLPALGFTRPSGRATIAVGQPATIHLGLRQATGDPVGASWTASAPSTLRVTPSSATLASSVPARREAARAGVVRSGPGAAASESIVLRANKVGHVRLTFDLRASSGAVLPPVVVNVTVTGSGGGRPRSGHGARR